MAILNYTTKISPEKTASEIQAILGKSGAQAVMSEYLNGEVTAVSFRFLVSGRLLSFRLPINCEGVLASLKNSKATKKYLTTEQATRTAWRIVKDWVEAQMALVEAGQAEVVEVFLPYLQDDSGVTVYKKLQASGFKSLAHEVA